MATDQGSAPHSKADHHRPRKDWSHRGGTRKQLPSIQTVGSIPWEGIQKARLAGACSNVLQQKESLPMAPPAAALILAMLSLKLSFPPSALPRAQSLSAPLVPCRDIHCEHSLGSCHYTLPYSPAHHLIKAQT